MALPLNIGYCTVTGRFIRAILDGPDPGKDPDGVPIPGLTITFTANMSPAVVRSLNTTPPVTVFIDPIVATTNSSGVLVGPDLTEGIKLIASDDPNLDPSGWTYTVTITGPSIQREAYSFVARSGVPVDLSTVVKLPAAPGATLLAWQSAVATTLDARDEVVALVGAGGGGSGKSAYQIAVDGGFVGTEAAWVTSLKGAKGDAGTAATITSVTASALTAGATPTVTLGGTSTARTIALGIPVGAQGAAGTNGTNGTNGSAGAAGPIIVDAQTYTGSAWPPCATTARFVFWDSQNFINAPTPPAPPAGAGASWLRHPDAA